MRIVPRWFWVLLGLWFGGILLGSQGVEPFTYISDANDWMMVRLYGPEWLEGPR